jgi:23S rRNA (pseudouridine1915-N3)-methyltransferase
MFRINIIAIGKNKDDWIESAVAHYLKLLKKYASVSIKYLPDIKNSKNLSEEELKLAEAELISKNKKSQFQIALSDKGKTFNTLTFAEYLESLKNQVGIVDFIIGGIYGLDESLIKECNLCLSLSPMTMSHQLVRPVFLEQLYRCFSINAGGKYHK